METTTSTPTTSIITETETTLDPIVTTEQVITTISNFGDKTITEPINEETTETMPITLITEANRQAIFFKVPTAQESEQSSDFSLNSRIRFKDDTFSNDQPLMQNSTNFDYVNSSKITFKQEAEPSSDLLTSENVRHTTNVIRFPDDHENSRPSSEQSHFQKSPHEHYNPFNHRNRDKDLWQPEWKEANGRKSFLVRLSNINFSDIVQNRHSSPMYRQIPTEHLSYIFGRNNNRR